MKKTLSSLLFAPLLVVTATPFTDYIEADVDIVFQVRSLSEVRAALDAHPLTEVVQGPELQAFFEPAFRLDGQSSDESTFKQVMEDEFGLTYDELFNLFPGQGCLAIYGLTDLMFAEMKQTPGDRSEPEVTFMLEFSGSAERLDELMQIQFERNAEHQKEENPLIEHELVTEEFMGETLYFDERFDGDETVVEDGYAFVDGVFVLAAPEERLRMAVEAIKGGANEPLAEHEYYLRAQEAAGDADVNLFVNLGPLMEGFTRAIEESPAMQSLAMVAVTPASLSDALSLDSVRAAFMQGRLSADSLVFDGGLMYTEKSGILSLMTSGSGDLPDAPYVPRNATGSSVSLYDMSAMLSNLEVLLRVASPTMMPLWDIQIAKIKSEIGVDLRESILKNFKPGMVSIVSVPEATITAQGAEPEQVILMNANDTATLEQAFEAIKDLAPPVKSMIKVSDYEGYQIHTLENPAAEGANGEVSAVSYTITRDQFIFSVGRVGLLQTILSRMGSGESGLWESDEVASLFEVIERPSAVSRSYLNLSQYAEVLFRELAVSDVFQELGLVFDFGQIPKSLGAEVRVVSEVNEASDGLFFRSAVVHLEE
ncbi:MAG: hypothetical protein ACPGES_01505 [Coraliomargarita sp.]